MVRVTKPCDRVPQLLLPALRVENDSEETSDESSIYAEDI